MEEEKKEEILLDSALSLSQLPITRTASLTETIGDSGVSAKWPLSVRRGHLSIVATAKALDGHAPDLRFLVSDMEIISDGRVMMENMQAKQEVSSDRIISIADSSKPKKVEPMYDTLSEPFEFDVTSEHFRNSWMLKDDGKFDFISFRTPTHYVELSEEGVKNPWAVTLINLLVSLTSNGGTFIDLRLREWKSMIPGVDPNLLFNLAVHFQKDHFRRYKRLFRPNARLVFGRRGSEERNKSKSRFSTGLLTFCKGNLTLITREHPSAQLKSSKDHWKQGDAYYKTYTKEMITDLLLGFLPDSDSYDRKGNDADLSAKHDQPRVFFESHSCIQHWSSVFLSNGISIEDLRRMLKAFGRISPDGLDLDYFGLGSLAYAVETGNGEYIQTVLEYDLSVETSRGSNGIAERELSNRFFSWSAASKLFVNDYMVRELGLKEARKTIANLRRVWMRFFKDQRDFQSVDILGLLWFSEIDEEKKSEDNAMGATKSAVWSCIRNKCRTILDYDTLHKSKLDWHWFKDSLLSHPLWLDQMHDSTLAGSEDATTDEKSELNMDIPDTIHYDWLIAQVKNEDSSKKGLEIQESMQHLIDEAGKEEWRRICDFTVDTSEALLMMIDKDDSSSAVGLSVGDAPASASSSLIPVSYVSMDSPRASSLRESSLPSSKLVVRQDLIKGAPKSNWNTHELNSIVHTSSSFDFDPFRACDLFAYVTDLSTAAHFLNPDFERKVGHVLSLFGEVRCGPVKTEDRIRSKTESDYSNAAEGYRWPYSAHVLDVIRISVTVDSLSQLSSALDAFVDECKDSRSPLKILRVKNQFAKYGAKVRYSVVPSQYCDIKMNVSFTSEGRALVGEVQFLLRNILNAKKKGHELYEIVRGEELIRNSLAHLWSKNTNQFQLLSVAGGSSSKMCMAYLSRFSQVFEDVSSLTQPLVGRVKRRRRPPTKTAATKSGSSEISTMDSDLVTRDDGSSKKIRELRRLADGVKTSALQLISMNVSKWEGQAHRRMLECILLRRSRAGEGESAILSTSSADPSKLSTSSTTTTMTVVNDYSDNVEIGPSFTKAEQKKRVAELSKVMEHCSDRAWWHSAVIHAPSDDLLRLWITVLLPTDALRIEHCLKTTVARHNPLTMYLLHRSSEKVTLKMSSYFLPSTMRSKVIIGAVGSSSSSSTLSLWKEFTKMYDRCVSVAAGFCLAMVVCLTPQSVFVDGCWNQATMDSKIKKHLEKAKEMMDEIPGRLLKFEELITKCKQGLKSSSSVIGTGTKNKSKKLFAGLSSMVGSGSSSSSSSTLSSPKVSSSLSSDLTCARAFHIVAYLSKSEVRKEIHDVLDDDFKPRVLWRYLNGLDCVALALLIDREW